MSDPREIDLSDLVEMLTWADPRRVLHIAWLRGYRVGSGDERIGIDAQPDDDACHPREVEVR